MKKHVKIEELSAYLDGEGRRPDRIAAHLKSCQECRDRYDRMSSLSARMHSLPEPDISFGFTGRVMRKIEAAPPRPARWLRPLVPAALVAAIAAAVFMYQAPEELRDPVQDETAAIVETLEGEEVLITELAGLIVETGSEDIDQILDEAILNEPDFTPVTTEDMILALANEDWFTYVADEWADDEVEDIDAAITELDAEEQDTLFQVLTDFARGNAAI